MKENIGEQLRDEYINFFSQYVNNGDINKLVDEAVKCVSNFVKFTNGKIFVFKKRYIITNFVIYPEETIQTKEKFFEVNFENFYEIDDVINGKSYGYNSFPKVKNNNFVSLVSQKYLNKHNCHLSSLGTSIFKLNLFDKILLERELEVQKIKLKKQLETYWKKYGTSKLSVFRMFPKNNF